LNSFPPKPAVPYLPCFRAASRDRHPGLVWGQGEVRNEGVKGEGAYGVPNTVYRVLSTQYSVLVTEPGGAKDSAEGLRKEKAHGLSAVGFPITHHSPPHLTGWMDRTRYGGQAPRASGLTICPSTRTSWPSLKPVIVPASTRVTLPP